MFQLTDYDFELPPRLIAQHPVAQRDQARLLVSGRRDGTRRHTRFHCLPEVLRAGDVLVLNNTQVVAGRLLGRKASGGRVEALILDYAAGVRHNRFNCMLRASKRPKPGSELLFEKGLTARVLEVAENRALLAFEGEGDIEARLEAAGHVPLPPYIRRADTVDDRRTYQTVYAEARGAIAAPTAGLHFTPALLETLRRQGVELLFLTLHVGYGTFVPVRVADIRAHRMHAEAFTLPAPTASALNRAKEQGRRVIAVGTTSVRTLEFCADAEGRLQAGSGWCDLFIYPGYRFKVIDGLITNFHLPQSTLLMLVAAFAGREAILELYAEAVRCGYRFFSYGDAMAVL